MDLIPKFDHCPGPILLIIRTMRKLSFKALLTEVAIMIFISAGCLAQDTINIPDAGRDSVLICPDGIYSGLSRGIYIDEPYWGLVRFAVAKGRFTDISFGIRDSSLHEPFDGRYEKHFAGNPDFIQQSRNDWAGVQAYPARLSKVQDTSRLDAISGATWSFNIFRAAVKDAFKKVPRTDSLSGTSIR
jgi:major membrane immunogen (membrane-anchored lipoprotein)